MRFISLFLFTVILASVASATPIVLYDSDNNPIGTATNPLKASLVGGGDLILDGNVGIGTSSVTSQLTIQGTAEQDYANLGAELLSASGWTSTDWTGDFSTGWDHTTGNTTALTNTLAAVTGTYYQIAYTVTGRTAGTFTITFGGVTLNAASATGAQGPRTTSTGTLSIAPTTDFDGTIILSIKAIYDATPVYSIKDSTGTDSVEIRGSLSSLVNTFIGNGAGAKTTTGTGNHASGVQALYSNTTGNNNTAVGRDAGRYIADGSTENTTSDYGIFIGYLTKPKSDDDQNEIVIGLNAIGNGSNTATIGNTTQVDTYIYGDINTIDGAIYITGGTTKGFSSGKSTCWHSSGRIGYCSSTVDASGNCTCN